MADGLARPLEALARQAGEVVQRRAAPCRRAKGTRELGPSRSAFNKALDDLVQAPQAARHDRAHRRTKRDRAPGRARDQKSARSHPRRGRDAAPASRARAIRRSTTTSTRRRKTVLVRGSSHHQDRLGVHRVRSAAGASSRLGRSRRSRQEHRRPLRSRRRRRLAPGNPLPHHSSRSRSARAGADQPHSERPRCFGRAKRRK